MFNTRIIHTFVMAVVLLTAATAANATTIGVQGGWEFNLGAKTSLTSGYYRHDRAATNFYFDQSRYGVLAGLSILNDDNQIESLTKIQLLSQFSGGLISLLNLPLFHKVYIDCNSGDNGSKDNGNSGDDGSKDNGDAPTAPGTGAGEGASDVPEPSGVALFGLGLLGLLVTARRRRV